MQSESADYNLLKPLAILLDERHLGRAAKRYHLSQSAMSRALARMRETFGDELLVQTADGYELTPRARALQRELADLLPRLAALVRGDVFDPATMVDTVKLHCTDYVTTLFGPTLFRRAFTAAPSLSLVVERISGDTFDDMVQGRVDVALAGVKPPAPLRWQRLFVEEHVCVVSRDHPVSGPRIELDELARLRHVTVVALRPEMMNAQRQLINLGVQPSSGLQVPYFAAATMALPGTQLVAILPRRFAALYADDPTLRTLEAPEQFTPFDYGMAWHPRLTGDPVQTWLRDLIGTVIREACIKHA